MSQGIEIIDGVECFRLWNETVISDEVELTAKGIDKSLRSLNTSMKKAIDAARKDGMTPCEINIIFVEEQSKFWGLLVYVSDRFVGPVSHGIGCLFTADGKNMQESYRKQPPPAEEVQAS